MFPVCRRWRSIQNDTGRGHFKSSLAQFEREHSQADEALADLRGLVADDSPPCSAHAAVGIISEAVVRLEHSVHEQIYKENRILFPRAFPLRGVA